MNRVPDVSPAHRRLIEEVTALRKQASLFVCAHRRVAYIRGGSNEAIYLNAVSWSLEHAEALYKLASSGDGSLVLDVEHGPDGFGRPKLTLKPPPAKVLYMEDFLARRAAAAS